MLKYLESSPLHTLVMYADHGGKGGGGREKDVHPFQNISTIELYAFSQGRTFISHQNKVVIN
jgi:hypothetical protein